MKFSTALTSLILIIPLFTGEVLGAVTIGRANGGKGGNNKGAGKQGKGAAQAAQNGTAAAAANNTAAAAANNTAAAAANNTAANSTVLASNAAANNSGAANNNADPQTSTTLDPAVIATGFQQNGQNVSEAGQVASLTSSNNFINFCLTVPNKPITNGQQIKTGSCNPAPMGVIAATTNMPSSKFQSPVNGQDIAPNTAFTINMAVNNLETGNFVNAQSNYYAAPQQINAQGNIIGHTHFTVQAVSSFTSTTPLDPNVFAFFKGVNTPAVNGVVSESVSAGLPAGSYRLCSINTDANHAPCLVAVAQHGNIDDCVYFSVGGNNNNPFSGNANAASAAGNSTGAAAASNSTGAAAANNSTGAAASNSTGAAAAASNATVAVATNSTGAAAKGAGAKKGGKGGRKAGGRRVRLGDFIERDY